MNPGFKEKTMKKTILLLICGILICLAPIAAQQNKPSVQDIIKEYLGTPHSKNYDENRLRRLHILSKLQSMPNEAVYEISLTLNKTENFVQRVELIEVLGKLATPESANILVDLLDDSEVKIRRQAIMSLRLLSSRIHRSGVVNVPKGPDFPPKVEGIVPVLIKAADDEDGNNRILALFALTDTRDSIAVVELKKRLNDPNEKVRFKAACFLTEFNDSLGLPELEKKLLKLRNISPDEEFTYYFDAEHLIVSLQRITGVSMGKIPVVPDAISSFKGQEESKRDYDKLLKAWDSWLKKNKDKSEYFTK